MWYIKDHFQSFSARFSSVVYILLAFNVSVCCLFVHNIDECSIFILSFKFDPTTLTLSMKNKIVSKWCGGGLVMKNYVVCFIFASFVVGILGIVKRVDEFTWRW